ncbi:MAG: TRAP transporter substrate-binding protein [Spirochaetales bacterium]|nr:TRAP transporter substrate-binding protein [Spirochaetales bacterium]
MKRIMVFMLVALIALASVFANGSSEKAAEPSASKEVNLKFALQNGQNHPLCQGVAKMAELVEQKSNGRIKIQLFYSGALGNKASTVQGMQTGTIDAGMLMGGVIADYGADQLKVFTLPYLFDSVEHARKFEKSADGQAVFDSVQSSGSRIVCLGAYQESARNFFFMKKDVKTPADLKDMMIRCQEGSVYFDTMEAMGGNVQSVAFSELYSALQAGVVDGAEQPLSGFVNNSFHEICKHYTLDQHEISPNLILFSEVTWKKLSAEDQQIIREAFAESVPYFEELSDKKDAEYLETMKKAGVTITEVNPADWQNACKSVYDKYGSKYADIINKISAAR